MEPKTNIKKLSQYCFICGYNFENESEESFRRVVFSNTCDCCLFQYGVDDTYLGLSGIMTYRKDWIEKGLPYRGEILPKYLVWTLNVALKQLLNLKKINMDMYFNHLIALDNTDWTSIIDEDRIKHYWNIFRSESI